jgi:hypothetical protein
MSKYEEIKALVDRAVPGHWSDVSDYECRKLLPLLLKALELACDYWCPDFQYRTKDSTPAYWIEKADEDKSGN